MTTAPTTAAPFTNVTATGTSTATATGSGSAHSGPGPAPDRGPGSASAPGSPSVSGPASGFDAVAGLSWEELVKFGMIPEFIGRLPVLTSVHNLDREALL
ncbi:hypothetical protein, partial [Streptomyces californicus]|uniref:hypothetical protein n=1 Tax=Streptomyces californicus TaxID=67351 RepID=UPI0033C2BF2B